MLRTLALLGVAAVAGRHLYKNGTLHRLRDDFKRRTAEWKALVADRGPMPAGAAARRVEMPPAI